MDGFVAFLIWLHIYTTYIIINHNKIKHKRPLKMQLKINKLQVLPTFVDCCYNIFTLFSFNNIIYNIMSSGGE